MRLAGKVALISGGARGMGAAEARLFAQEGARIVIGDILEGEGAAVAAGIGAKGGEAVFVRLDVTSESDWERAVATAERRFGKLDVLVNNAGIGGVRPLAGPEHAGREPAPGGEPTDRLPRPPGGRAAPPRPRGPAGAH